MSKRERIAIIRPGDTLQSLAAQYYEDASLASYLAQVNGTAVNAILTVGARIRVPERVQTLPALGDVPGPAPATLAPVVTTGSIPWYAHKLFWIGAAGGVVLAWFLMSQKSPIKKLL